MPSQNNQAKAPQGAPVTPTSSLDDATNTPALKTRRFASNLPLFNQYLFDAPIAFKDALSTWSANVAKSVFNSR